MLPTEEILKKVSRQTSALNKIIIVVGPVAILVGGVYWYFNNIWKPTVKVTNANYDANTATLLINGKTRVLYSGSTINAGFGWGVRFAGSAFDTYDRIEVVKNDLAYKTISTKI